MRTPVFAALLATALATWSPPSAAEEAAADGVCRADVQRLCVDLPPGVSGSVRCLLAHESELSAECSAVLAGSQPRANTARGACTADAARLCSQAEPGPSAVSRCLRSNTERLSDACREVVGRRAR